MAKSFQLALLNACLIVFVMFVSPLTMPFGLFELTIVQYGLDDPNNADLRCFESVQATGRSDVLHIRVILLVAN